MSLIPADVKIILAENAKPLRKSGVKILNSLGYKDILEAEDGLQAKKNLQTRKGVSLVIADWSMPEMGGDELLLWMRKKSKKFKKTPFIMVVKQSDKVQANKAKEAGATSIVAKPFTSDELQTEIEQALEAHKDQKKLSNDHLANVACKKHRPQQQATLPPAAQRVPEHPKQSQDQAKEQVSLSQLLFDKGIPSPTNINPEQLKALAEDQDKMAEENEKLRAEIAQLKATLNHHDMKAKDLFKKGVQHLKNEHFFEAAGCFNALLIFEPDNIMALNNLAVIYFEMEMDDKARESFENILRIDPANELARENLAEITQD